MKTTLTIAILIALPLGISGCGKKAEAPTEPMTNMSMSSDAKMGEGTGTVTAIDKAAGKITLDHGAIPAVEWPAMTMGFAAKPDLLTDVTVGEKVRFSVAVTASSAEITTIAKQ